MPRALALDRLQDGVGVRLAHVRVAVREHDHAADLAAHVRAFREPVRELDAAAHRGRAVRVQLVDCIEDFPTRRSRRGRQDLAHLAGVRAERDRVVGPERVREQPQALLRQWQPVVRRHRAAGVDQIDEVHARALGSLDAASLDRDAQQMMSPVERRRSGIEMNRERIRGRGLLRARVAVVEGVDELFGAHRDERRTRGALELAARERVGRGVHVDRKRRERILGGVDDRVDAVLGVLLAALRIETIRGGIAGLRG